MKENLDLIDWSAEPAMPSSQGLARWKAGQARPASALPVTGDHGAAAALLGLGLVGPVAVWSGAAQAGTLVTLGAAWAWFFIGLSPGIEALAGRSLSARVARSAVSSAAAGLAERVMTVAQGLSLVSLVVAGFVAKMAPQAGRDVARDAMSGFRSLVDARLARLKGFIEDGRSADPAGLTAVGSWRLARHLMANGSPELAARAWAAKPFNPHWATPVVRMPGGAEKFKGRAAPFVEALEFASRTHRDPERGLYCGKVASVARSMMERREITAGVAEAAESTGSEPARKRRL